MPFNVEAVEQRLLHRTTFAHHRVAGERATYQSSLEYVPDDLDLILVLTANPGFGGQSFTKSQMEKVGRVREMIGDRPIRLTWGRLGQAELDSAAHL